MKRTTLTKTAALALFIMLLAAVTPVYAKPKTKTGDTNTITVVSGEGEQVALWREGKIIWDGVEDVPLNYYVADGGLPWIEITGATWITYDYESYAPSDNSWYIYKATFDIPGTVKEASISITADNAYMLHMNGKLVGRDGSLFQPIPKDDVWNWMTSETYDLTNLKEGSNDIVVYVRNYGMSDGTWAGNPTGLVFSIEITYFV